MSNGVYNNGQAKLFSTRNYNDFIISPHNRAIDPNHVEYLYDRIRQKNLLLGYPMIVSSNMTVIDGQHRLKAAEALGVPIYYVVADEATLDDIALTNAATKKWTNEDYLHKWIAAGKSDYAILKSFWDQNKQFRGRPFLSLSISMRLTHFGTDSGIKRKFQEGDYSCNDLPNANRVVRAVIDYAGFPSVTFYSHTVFVRAVANLINNPNYDHNVMMHRLKNQSTRLVQCVSVEEYIRLINDIYNYNATSKTRAYLEYINPTKSYYRVDRRLEKLNVNSD